ncbi:MAG: hypothetical protein R8P61_04820 [Bacteroidia bacterium]|nr:hypothetical protein [Bacteroidia bacterium]
MSHTIKIPNWILVLSFLFFLSNLFVFGGLSMFFPQIAFPDAGESATFPIEFFAIRHIALAFPLLYGVVKKDAKVLWTCFSVFLVMTILDVILLFLKAYYIPVIGEVPMILKIIMAFGVFIGPVSLSWWKLNQILHAQQN